MGNNFRRQRAAMWKRDPRCYYCRVPTVLPEHVEGPKVSGSPKVSPPNMATIDHLRPRHHPARREPTDGMEVRRVLACFKCNNERDRMELEAMPREKLWQMNGSKPLHMKPLDELRRIEKILLDKRPRRKRDRESVARSIAEVQEAIAERAVVEVV